MKLLSMLLLSLVLTSCTKPNIAHGEYPSLIQSVRPDYPIYAFQNRIEGKVEFEFDVDAEGKVSEMRITKSEPQHLFDDVVIMAVSKWRYEKNKPAKNMRMTINFTISSHY